MVKNKRQFIISLFILIIALGFGFTIGAIAWIINDTPDISNYKGSSETTLIYSADGQLLTKLYKENRIYVPLERIPRELQDAIIAIEDTNFYVHHGVDFWGVFRAIVTNIIKNREKPHGASTITQQLAGNVLLNRQNVSYYRKIQEAYLALQFERLYTKPEILEMYLNEILLGHSAYGVEAAAQQYFNKHIWELNLSESALIAGLPKAPNYYSPFNNYELSINRRNIVLNRMLELGYINEKETNNARNREIIISSSLPDQEETAPYFIRYIRDKLIEEFGAQITYTGGLKVYTSIDLEMQEKAEAAIENALKEYIPTIERSNTADKLQPQLALITIDPKSGEIRAMVGGRGHDQFNRATQAVRQPGSAFKPFVYTTAIKQGYSPASVINDMPMLAKPEKNEIPGIWPTNFEDKYMGYVSLRTALTNSINVVAVKLLQKIGIGNTINTAEDMGISTFQAADREKDHLSLALGGLNKGVIPLEMASAYGVLANQGIWVEPIAITRVLDNRDRVLYEAHPEKKIVLSDDVVYLITDMLRSVITQGTGWRANLNRPVAGKTGTTNDYTDAWFVGYTPDLVTAVWIGEDNLHPMIYDQKDEKGNYLYPENGNPRTISSSEAAHLWGDYMRQVVKDMPVSYFPKIENIVQIEIDPVTGLLPNIYTPQIKKEIFRKENIPEEIDYIHEAVETVKIDKSSGLLATVYCPDEEVEEYDYFTESKIRVGPATITFGTNKAEVENEENNKIEVMDIKGSYIVDTGEPVQKIDPSTGVPLIDEFGQVLYETKPDKKCPDHKPFNDDLLKSIWNFFNIKD